MDIDESDSAAAAAGAAAEVKVEEEHSKEWHSLEISHSVFGHYGGSGGEYTLLVELVPEDDDSSTKGASIWDDLEGSTGAIGRLEEQQQPANEESAVGISGDVIRLDVKGHQYTGRLFPGPTLWVLSEEGPSNNTSDKTTSAHALGGRRHPQLRIEAWTDEFCRLVHAGRALDQLPTLSAESRPANDEDDDDDELNEDHERGNEDPAIRGVDHDTNIPEDKKGSRKGNDNKPKASQPRRKRRAPATSNKRNTKAGTKMTLHD